MAAFFTTIAKWFAGSGAMAERTGQQNAAPTTALVPDVPHVGPDGALQLSAVWACIERRANILASLPLFTYQRLANGQKELARETRLYQLLHDSPNSRMTPFEFWRALMMNHDLRGAGYARIDRDEATGEALAIWPMPADQVTPLVLDDGAMVYQYQVGADVAVYAEENVLVIKNLGNGTVGLSKLDFMRATVAEAGSAQANANRLFSTSGKPTGVLMVDGVLSKEQREAVRERFAEMQTGSTARLFVLEASMKYQQLSLSPEDQQLLQTRQFAVEEICRWFDVPPVMVHHSNVTTWGSGVEQIIDGFYKMTLGPLVVGVEQAIRKRVLTPAQRARYTCEFSIDALLRGSLKDRAEIFAKLSQNGGITRNEFRQLENWPRVADPMADALTVQTNLLPIGLLGQQPTAPKGGTNAASQDPITQ